MESNKYSDYKLFHFPVKLESLLNRTTSSPLYVRIKPFNACNHDCFFCVYSQTSRKNKGTTIEHESAGMHTDIDLTESLPLQRYLSLPQELHDTGVKAITLSGGGEPLMHPGTPEVLSRFRHAGIKTSCITNGQVLNKDCARELAHSDWVRVSIDYSTPEEMVASRNVPASYFDHVLSNISDFSTLKSDHTDLFVNYIVHRHNYAHLYSMAKLLKDCGVMNLRFSPMWTPDFEEHHQPIQADVQRQLDSIREDLVDTSFTVNTTYVVSSGLHSSHRSYHRCFVMETIPVIGADQCVYACHNKAFDKTGLLGSIEHQTFKDLWFSPELRHYFDSFDAQITCQHQCSNDNKNIIMNEVYSSSDDPFI